MTPKKLSQLFWKHARKIKPSIGKIRLEIGKPSEFPQPRNHAYTYGVPGGPLRVVFAPRIFQADTARTVALIRHELAHALMLYQGVDHTERQCDAVAETLWKAPIYYDAEDVQTLRKGVRPRPGHLPK